ncbi:MAG: glycosyltransferase involved in cell wall biosynthesis [Myxococcota bacterium]|jgi:glycosyltransferase involved in cell wall biosynthesis
MTTILLSPGDPGQLTGGYRYNSRLFDSFQDHGREVRVVSLPGDWPLPSRLDIVRCGRIVDDIEPGTDVIIDGLALAGVSDALLTLCARCSVSLLLHSPPHLERGTAPQDAARLYAITEQALLLVHRVIATSPTAAAEIVTLFGVPEVSQVTPGCDIMPKTQGAGTGRLLSVATVTPRKGLLTLIAALARIPELPWTLRCVGSLTRAPAHVAQAREAIAAAGLTERIALVGERDGALLTAEYAAADIFVLPTWHETYGMVFTEAMSAGLPIISTTAGAVPQTVPSGVGILVTPGDSIALAEAIRGVLTDRSQRDAFAAAASAWPIRSWADCAADFAAILDGASHG